MGRLGGPYAKQGRLEGTGQDGPGSTSETARYRVCIRQGSPGNQNRGVHYVGGGCFREPVCVTGWLMGQSDPCGPESRGGLGQGSFLGRSWSSLSKASAEWARPTHYGGSSTLIQKHPCTVTARLVTKHLGTVAARRRHTEVVLTEQTCSSDVCGWAWPLPAADPGAGDKRQHLPMGGACGLELSEGRGC